MAQSVRFSIGQRGRPRLGSEAKVFVTANPDGIQELAEFLIERQWMKLPKVRVQLVGEIRDGHIEVNFDKIMVVIDATNEVIFSTQPELL